VVAFLRTLKASRDMTVQEAKLVIAIEDPRARERRQLGIEVCAGGGGAGAGGGAVASGVLRGCVGRGGGRAEVGCLGATSGTSLLSSLHLDETKPNSNQPNPLPPHPQPLHPQPNPPQPQDDRGVSRDEMAAALEEVASGKIPRDRLALKCLYDDMAAWPYLTDLDTAAAAANIAAATAADAVAGKDPYVQLNSEADQPVAKPYILGNEARKGDKPQSLEDLLPDWVGYGALYGLSSIPVLLVVGATLVLFYSSLR